MKNSHLYHCKTSKKEIFFILLGVLFFSISLFSSCLLSCSSRDYQLDKISFSLSNYLENKYPSCSGLEPIIRTYPDLDLDVSIRKKYLSDLNSKQTFLSSIFVATDLSNVSCGDINVDVSLSNMLSFYDYSGYQEKREPKLWRFNSLDLYTLFAPNVWNVGYSDFAYISQSMADYFIENGVSNSYDSLLTKELAITIGDDVKVMIINNIIVDSTFDANGTLVNEYGSFLKKQYGDYFFLTYSMSEYSSNNQSMPYYVETFPYCSSFSIRSVLQANENSFGKNADYVFLTRKSSNSIYQLNGDVGKSFALYLDNTVSPWINIVSLLFLAVFEFLFFFSIKKRIEGVFASLCFDCLVLAIVGLVACFAYFYYVWGIWTIVYLLACLIDMYFCFKKRIVK